MHLNNKPPIFVPFEFQREIETLSKAALMDLAWDLIAPTIPSGSPDDIMSELRKRADIVVSFRATQHDRP